MASDHDHSSPPTTEEIAQCAYLIWEKEGKQPGRDREYWMQAETQLRATRAHNGWTSGKSTAS